MQQWISRDRNYEFNIKLGPWEGDFPSMFRVWRPLQIGNYRHDYMDCEKLDKDPKRDDIKVIAVWGSGLGITHDNQIGVVTNFAACGSYFLAEKTENGDRIIVKRENIGHSPEKG